MLNYTPDGELLLQSQRVSHYGHREWQLYQYNEWHSYKSQLK